MHRFSVVAVLGAALSACAGSAPPAAAPSAAAPHGPPALSPALASLAFYVGSWQCKGTSYAADGAEQERWDARIDVEPELGGSWLSVRMTGPGDNRTIEHKGYDASTHRWVHLAVSGDGSWGVVTSPGWTGSAMVFTPDDPDGTHATFTRLSETSYSHAVTRDTEKGPVKVWEKRCTKQ
ncbi:MAG TPA: hypothetical protein VK698_25355 [Kofleriaceae bacterium]|nr:hypothetical protein [Kofleriaceae bacterium]